MSPTKAPSWRKYEKKMHSEDPKEARKAGELFDKEREWETSHDDKLKDWEKGRKSSIAKQKPAWVKKQMKEEQEETTKEMLRFKKGGNLDYVIHPARGFLLVKIIQKDEEKTESGFMITNSDEIPNDVAEVLAVGAPIPEDDKFYSPCNFGDKVLLKKMAGLELTSFGESLRICMFSDVLAVLE